ncbi:hypothetical protein RJT34_17490 [Clitoria ternatea]|uniref:Uncharacterized protein n=1 Tax=Clitoria ternatea TaxID=43366 RepID=A0AAN9JAN7_CLITE
MVVSQYTTAHSYSNCSPVEFRAKKLVTEPMVALRSSDIILVTILFRPLSFPYAMSYRVFGPHINSNKVYEVVAEPVVKIAMKGVNGVSMWRDNLLSNIGLVLPGCWFGYGQKRIVLAMQENGIGLFPDVGFAYMAVKIPGKYLLVLILD